MADPNQPPGGPQGGDDQQSLQGFASDAEEALVKLATGLAQAGASPQVVSSVHKLADMTRQIGQALGQAGGGPGQPPGAQPQAQPPGGPGGPPGAPQGQPQQAGPPMTMDAATQHLHDAMQASAAMRQQGGRPQR